MIDRKTRDVLRGKVMRIEAHPATPGTLDHNGKDWNCDTLRLIMEDGSAVDISGGCHGIETSVVDWEWEKEWR